MTGQNATRQTVERRSGVALWRQIADAIRQGIEDGLAGEDGRLPPETALAERFGVNRHTVRAAISALVRENILRAEQGRGTFVAGRGRLAYPIARRTRFSAGLAGQTRDRTSKLITSSIEPATPEVAAALALEPSSKVVRLETLGVADGTPVSRSTLWFDAARFRPIAGHFRKTGSVTAALAALGVTDYLRRSTSVEARHANAADSEDLQLSPGAIVLVARAVNTDLDGNPIQFAVTRFAADRVELTIESEG